jgi:rhodanese-related sulfurtransferase
VLDAQLTAIQPARQSQDGSPDLYIDTLELRRLNEAGRSPVLVDARSHRSFDDSNELVEQAIRLDPERAVEDAKSIGLPRDVPLAVFCA